MRVCRRALVTLLCLITLTGSVAFAGALILPQPSPFKPLSPYHTNYGVSQYLMVHPNAPTNTREIKLFNPGPAEMVAAILVYTSPDLDTPGDESDFSDTPGEYLGCMTLPLPPHGSARLDGGFFDESVTAGDYVFDVNGGDAINDDEVKRYFEVISVPRDLVAAPNVFTRIADGLGLHASATVYGEGVGRLLHPSLFSLPSDSTERQDAADCLCAAANAEGQPMLWRNFGVMCF